MTNRENRPGSATDARAPAIPPTEWPTYVAPRMPRSLHTAARSSENPSTLECRSGENTCGAHRPEAALSKVMTRACLARAAATGAHCVWSPPRP